MASIAESVDLAGMLFAALLADFFDLPVIRKFPNFYADQFAQPSGNLRGVAQSERGQSGR